MKQTIRGWKIGLKDGEGRKFFLGRYRTSPRGSWKATMCYSPLERRVFSNLFDSADEAISFWKTCKYNPYMGKEWYTPIPVKLEMSVDVIGLGFDWNGI